MKLLLRIALLISLGAASPPVNPAGTLVVKLEGVRNLKGVVRACLMKDARAFPACERDPHSIKLSVPASATSIRFEQVQPGDYALALFHDENANNRLDTLFGIPREGFGFSRNPRVRFGAPRFNDASITIGAAITRLSVRLQYIL